MKQDERQLANRYPAPPDEQLAALVLTVLAAHGRILEAPGWRAEIAPGGSTDRTFRILDPSGTPAQIVRLARPGLADRLQHEQRTLAELSLDPSESDVTPPRIPGQVALIEDGALPERWLLVHEHLPGLPQPVADVSLAARETLGEGLAWLHRHLRESYMIWPSLETQAGTRAELFHARLDTLRRYRSFADVPGSAMLIDRLAAMPLPASAGWAEQGFALCHGDLSIGNILWDGDAVGLIDWEFARDGDASEDIAYLVAEQDLAPDLISDIADAYVVAGGDPWAFARLPAWLPFVALDSALWWADYWLAQGADPSTKAEVTLRLARAQTYLGL